MARKAVVNRSNPTNGKPLTRISKQPRASAPTSFVNEDDDSMDEIRDDDAEAEDAEGRDMLGITQELQKRKTAKSATHTNNFQNQKAAMYTKARQDAYEAVKDGNAYLDQALDQLRQLKSQEGSYEKRLKDITSLYHANDASVQSLLAIYPTLLQDLAPRKAEEMDAASIMLMSLPAERDRSRKKLMRNARAQIDEGLEKQKVATDAAALIKHYKALLLT